MNTASGSPLHSPALDGLRGLAIALVLLHNVKSFAAGSDPLGDLLSRVGGIGWIGVTLFFVLSGFLITRGLLNVQGSENYFQSFFARRALRIFPLYFVSLAFFFWILPSFAVPPQSIRDDVPHQIWYWLYLTNWTQHTGHGGMALPHFWSLAVEEQFYLVWPFLIWRRSPEQVLRICIGVIVISLMSRATLIAYEADPMQIYSFTVCRMDALAMGAIAAVWLHDRRLAPSAVFQWKAMLWVAGGALLLGRIIPSGYGMTDPNGQVLGYFLFAVTFTAILLAVMAAEGRTRAPWIEVLRWQPLRSAGKYSYGIYVFHAPFHEFVGVPLLARAGWLQHLSTSQGLIYLASFSAALYALARLSYHGFEVHFLRLKHLFSPRAEEKMLAVKSRFESHPTQSATPTPASER